MSNCFPSFIIRWILNFVHQPTHENHENGYPTNKNDFTVYWLILAYTKCPTQLFTFSLPSFFLSRQ